MDEIFSNEVYKGSTFPLFILIVHPNDWKRCFREWLAKGAKSQWFRVAEWCATRWRWCATCWAVRDPSRTFPQCKITTGATHWEVHDLLGGLHDPLSCLPPNFKRIPPSPFNSSQSVEVGSLCMVFEIGDGCKSSCYDFNLKTCKWMDSYGCNVHAQIVLGFMVFQAVFSLWLVSFPFPFTHTHMYISFPHDYFINGI